MERTTFRMTTAASVLASMASSFLPLQTIAFSDVSSGSDFSTAIEALEQGNVVDGYADGSFKPNATINRAEFLKIVLESRGKTTASASSCFPDVQTSDWFSRYVCGAKEEGIVSGYPSGLFHPEKEVNFVEATKILSLAFDQQIDMYSPDWYEPYARAIESSKGIPTSIDSLDQPLTRGEMAEMIWRLTENRTDRPTKGYLNVKYPEATVNFASDDVQTATSCADLAAFASEAGRSMDMYYGRDSDMAFPMANDGAESGAKAVPQTGGGISGDYSQTNVQVEGVDEADIVKTDGTHLYVVRGQSVMIVRADGTDLQEASSIDFSEDNFTPSELYVDGDMLAVIGSRWIQGQPTILEKRMAADSVWPGYYGSSKSEVRIYDISDRADPEISRRVSFDGSLNSSRRIGDKLYMVVNQPFQYWGRPIPLDNVKEADVVPSFSDSARGDAEMSVAPCSKIAILPHVPTPEYLTVGVVPLRDKTEDVSSEVVVGSAQNIYASIENLYVATSQYNYLWDGAQNKGPRETTNLFRFAFTDSGVDLKAEGSVPGRILNQFSMDEHGSQFRIATTDGYTWETETLASNNLYVMNAALDTVGKIEDIAPGEQIYSVRFIGDRAYMVTFKNIDPLFVIDTSDARNPKILGKLKIPGYSTYLHPYDEDHLIGFGKDALDAKDPNFAWYQGIKVALFDVSDVSNPKELHKMTIGDRGTDSPLLYNHKALLFEKDRNLLSFPVTIHTLTPEQKKQNDGSAYGSPTFQGAQVYSLTAKDGFTLRGSISHYSESDIQKMGDYWYGGGKDVERIVRIGDSLFTISQSGIRQHDEEDVKLQDSLDFPMTSPIEDRVY